MPMHAIVTIKEECNKQISCEVDIRYTTDVNHCLYDYGFLNVWYTCKKILDFSCDFESVLCNWSPEHDENRFKWKRGNRIDYLYTPSVDHTSASTTGKYVYIYAAGSKLDDIANLESGEIVAVEQQCLSFWYFTTNSRDSVFVYQNEKELVDLSDKEEEKWHHIQIYLEKNSYDSFKLVFKVVRGNGWKKHYGAISIDDILIENQNCNSLILNCDFESNSCDWNIDEFNKYVWKRQNGQPPFYHTGQTTDHSTASDSGNYMYLSSTVDTIAYLEFQNVNLHVSGNFCLTFWYHMYHDEDYEMERLNVTFDNELVWTDYANQDNKWKRAMIDLQNRMNMSIKFIGILGSNWWNDIDIAIDDISLAEGTCTGLFYHEDNCVQLDEKTPEETKCPKGYLNITNSRLSFDPEKRECTKIYDQTKNHLLKECENRDNSQKCVFDFSTEKSSHPGCYQLYEFQIMHTCEG
ncbi:MAM and LDL-receptor class A domain-containing protein 2-like [Mytilus californianus]|uniref:MAM and LDL-receptor class A domain-containing protein 2-like n=1 Tax=Mytilus californianus TaxID=6549 RepID=UPI002246479D|nr:MAM and LDL-receptor class A domain-containing protein 2-like [Mytilus californianus]